MKSLKILALAATASLCAHAADYGLGVAITSGDYDYGIHVPVKHDNGLRSIYALNFATDDIHYDDYYVGEDPVARKMKRTSWGLEYSLLWEVARKDSLSTQVGFCAGYDWRKETQDAGRGDSWQNQEVKTNGFHLGPRVNFEYAFNRTVSVNWGVGLVYTRYDLDNRNSETSGTSSSTARQEGKNDRISLTSSLSMRVYF